MRALCTLSLSLNNAGNTFQDPNYPDTTSALALSEPLLDD